MSIHRWFTGAFLLVVMLGALFVNALVFSARSFQHNFASISETGTGVVSMSAIRDVSREVANLEAEAAPNELKLAGIERQIEESNSTVEKRTKEIETGLEALLVNLAALEAKLQMPALSGGSSELGAISQRLDRLAASTRLTKADDMTLASLREQFAKLVNASDEIVAAGEAAESLQRDARQIQGLLNDNKAKVVQQKAAFGDNFDQIKAEIDALSYTSPYGWGATLAQVHPTFLSTTLVCMMGALGAILFLFPAYVAGAQNITFVTIIVRMAFGMLTAFAFFIVANSAIAAFGMSGGGASAAAGADSLNPFTIAGLGVIAGVMADDIAKWIHQRGVYLFSGGAQAAGGLAGAVRGAASEGRVIAPAKEDLPSGGLVNPQGGPHDPD